MDDNLTHTNYHTVHGQPGESGHYFCMAEHNGFVSQSASAILKIHGKRKTIGKFVLQYNGIWLHLSSGNVGYLRRALFRIF